MSNSSDEHQPESSGEDSSQDAGEGITDDKLPEDLRPTDDNPLAKPMGDDEDEESTERPGPGPDTQDVGDPGAT
jgi:hypothetical protein